MTTVPDDNALTIEDHIAVLARNIRIELADLDVDDWEYDAKLELYSKMTALYALIETTVVQA